MNRRQMLWSMAMVVSSALGARAQARPTVQVFKDPGCGCCGVWVEHLRRAGFGTTATDVDDMEPVKNKYRVPELARSCHTGLVGGYFIEGHVPAADIQRLLSERPDVLGIAVAGMPIGSPGMEGPDPRPYDVLIVDRQGRTKVFATHTP